MNKTDGTNKYYKFFMYLIVVVLVNIAGATLFFRADLTSNDIYSLSRASQKVVSTLSEPLTVKVFFTSNLPAPYNNIERYLQDLLQEYAVSGNRYFNYQFYNLSGEENEKAQQNQTLAQNYGIYPVQIQNIEQDEVKFQRAYMGLVLIHGDIIETIPTITSTEGLEFQITSTIQKMNNKISALLNLKDKVDVKLILSSSLQVVGPYMNLTGLSELPARIEGVVNKLNDKNYDRLTFTHLDPSREESDEEKAKQYNVLPLQWNEFQDRRGKTIPGNKGYAGIVVQHGDKVEEIPLINIVRLPIFGTQYSLMEMEELEGNINETIENIININEEIGYLADHGTHALGAGQPVPGQPRTESLSNFNALLSRGYSVTEVNLKEKGIPEGLPTLIIAGAKESFSDYELYQIDQFLMKGRNLAFFMDSFNEVVPPQQMMRQTQGPLYLPVNTGLEKLLSHYGAKVKASYLLDTNCYRQEMPRAFGGGERSVYFAPIIKNEFINKGLNFLKNIKGLVLLKTSPVEVDEEKVKNHGITASKLFSSSEKSWEMSGRINLNPMMMRPPQNDEDFQQVALAYTLEGSFPSYFADKPVPVKKEKKEAPGDPESSEDEEQGIDMSQVKSKEATIKKGKPGKIFLIGTSEVLKNNMLDEEGRTTNAQFVLNILDALNDREDYAVMRSKSQRFNPMRDVRPGTRTLIKTINIAGLPLLVIFSGMIVWFRRSSRKRLIQQIFRR